MIMRPPDMGKFEYVVLASLRAKQLTRGCIPRISGNHKAAVIARMEVSEGKVVMGEPATLIVPEIAVPVEES
jgi:DNA-directed RNA polymerase subunit K/omega